MEQFEFEVRGSQDPPEITSPKDQSQETQRQWELKYRLNKVYTITRKYYSRTFLNHLKSTIFRALLALAHPPQPPQQVFPFQALLAKKHKNQEEQFQCEFIHMCAQKIQSFYKGYLVRKYHKIVLSKLNKFNKKMSDLVVGWKTRRILKCYKMQELSKGIKVKKLEVAKQEKIAEETTNVYTKKKLEYLRKSLKDDQQQFKATMRNMYQSGTWVFEPRQIIKRPNRRPQTLKTADERTSRVQQAQNQSEEPSNQRVGTKRVREARQRAKKARNQEEPQIQGNSMENKMKQGAQGSPSSGGQKWTSTNGSQGVSFQDRPIQARGKYQLDSAVKVESQKVLKPKHDKNKLQNQVEEGENREGQSRKNKTRAVERQKMEKRQKYDPRKAIIEEKKKKLLIKAEPSLPQGQASQIIPRPSPQTIVAKQQVEVKSTNEEITNRNTVEMVRPEPTVSNRKTVIVPKGKTAAPEPRIDCWANKKIVKKSTMDGQTTSQPNINSYLKIHSNKDKSTDYQSRSLQKTEVNTLSKKLIIKMQSLIGKVQERGGDEERVEMNQRGPKGGTRVNEAQKQVRCVINYEDMRRQKYHHSPKRQDPLRQAHKQIQEIQAVYTQQYQNRLKKLIPKLQFMSGARQAERKGPIPVLSQDNSYIRRRIQQNVPTHKFWLTTNRIEKTFKEFDRV